MQAATKVSHRFVAAASGDAVTVLAFAGDIASTSKDAIMAAYSGIDGGMNKVLLDFRDVNYVNSSGIAIIIQLLLEAKKSSGRSIGIFGLTPHFVKVFTMVGVPKYATISPDESAALAGL